MSAGYPDTGKKGAYIARSLNDERRRHIVINFNKRNVTADRRIIPATCNENTAYDVRDCLANTPLQDLSDIISDARPGAGFVDDIVSYVQINPQGKVEGIVYIAGTKLIYNLDDLAIWYQREYPQ